MSNHLRIPVQGVRRAAALGAALALAGITSAAAHAFYPTPAKLFGPLFVRVQMAGVFPDGKTFVDAIPKASPQVILQRFRNDNPRTRKALLRFVERNFTLPPPDRTRPRRRVAP